MHLVDTRHVLAATVRRIHDARALADVAGVHANVGECAVRVRNDFEHECREGRIRRMWSAELDVWIARIHALDLCALGWIWEVVDDGIDDLLNTDVLQRSTAEHREALQVDRALAKACLDFRDRDG